MKKLVFKIFLICSVFFNVLFTSIVLFKTYNKNTAQTRSQFTKNYYKKTKLDIFSNLHGHDSSILFLGASLIEYGQWKEYFPTYTIVNRGVAGIKIDDVIDVIPVTKKDNPSKIFVMVGLNDLFYCNNQNNITKSYIKLIKKLKAQFPSANIFIQSVLPINEKICLRKHVNSAIPAINEKLKKVCNASDVGFIDLYPSFCDDECQLNQELTFDGIHLNSSGYTIWVEKIKTFF